MVIILSYDSLTNDSDEPDIAFYNGLSFQAWHISKHNILIIDRDINAQIGKDGNNKFCLHN